MAVSANKVYSQTLQSIIDAKLEELVKKHTVYERRKSEALRAIHSETDPVNQLRLLLDGTKHCFQIQQTGSGDLISNSTNRQQLFHLLINIEKFLEQPQYDASVSGALLSSWKSLILTELNGQSARYEYASLYAKLVTDWLSSEDRLATSSTVDADTEMVENFEELDDSDKLESKLAWEQSVFEQAPSIQEDEMKKTLVKLFGQGDPTKKTLWKALEALREDVSAFETELAAATQFNAAVIRWCIEGLLARGRLSEEKRSVLKDFVNNSTILEELADVLNLRMANISEWNWGETVPIEQRRRVTGNYSIDMNEDLLQAIYLHYVGSKWAVFLKRALTKIVDTQGVWLPGIMNASSSDWQRREFYLGHLRKSVSIESKRAHLWREQYLLTQLPSVERQKWLSHDGDEEASHAKALPPRKQLASKAARKSAPMSREARHRFDERMAKRARRMAESSDSEEDDDSDDSDDDENDDGKPQNLMELKQGLLHLLQTEMLVNTNLHGKLTAVRGQFERWDDLLPHETIKVVLSFMGVSTKWLNFFENFLQAPLSFFQDGQPEHPRTRKRGVPTSHPLSDALGEPVLFCMDVLINQLCEGTRLWRTHDDFWFWSPNHDLCVKAWSLVEGFSKTFGLVLNRTSTGSAVIGKMSNEDRGNSGLPSNPIRWGFLYLNSESGEFDIDQDMVDDHIRDFTRQLKEKSSKGVFSWIHAWNAYAITFFATNFGKPAICFGPGHIQKILSTLQGIQQQVFENSNMVRYIREMIVQRHGVKDVPDGYLFFPAELGGLDIKNPFIHPIQLSKQLNESSPRKRFEEWEEAERECYEHEKKVFERMVAHDDLPAWGRYSHNRTPRSYDRHTFMPFEEFTQWREEYTSRDFPKDDRLATIFRDLLKTPTEEPVELSHRISDAVNSSSANDHRSTVRHYGNIHPYWQWVFEVYGPEIIDKFGGLNIVDAGVLPIGMVSLVKGDRVQWK